MGLFCEKSGDRENREKTKAVEILIPGYQKVCLGKNLFYIIILQVQLSNKCEKWNDNVLKLMGLRNKIMYTAEHIL